MSFLNDFPHVRQYDGDLGWLIRHYQSLAEKLEYFVNYNSIKYADPIGWNITTQYEANTVVIDPADGTAYISSRPVPSGILVSNTDYWTPIFNYGENMDVLRAQIAAHNYGTSPNIGAEALAQGTLLWSRQILYRAMVNMAAGTLIIPGTNVERVTIEELLATLAAAASDLSTRLGTAEDDIDALEGRMDTAENDIDALQTWQESAAGDIAALEAAVVTPEAFGAIGDGVTDDSNAFAQACAAGIVQCDSTKTYMVTTIELASNAYVIGGNFVIPSFPTGPNYDYRYVFEAGKNKDVDLISCTFTSTADQIPRINALNNKNYGSASNVIAAHSIGSCDHIRLIGCTLTNVGGIYIAGNNIMTAVIDNCHFVHTEFAVYAHSRYTDIYVSNSTIDLTLDTLDVYYHAFYIAWAKHVTVTGCVITESGSGSANPGNPLHFSDPEGVHAAADLFPVIISGCNVYTTAAYCIQNGVAILTVDNCNFSCPVTTFAALLGVTKNMITFSRVTRDGNRVLIYSTGTPEIRYTLIDNGSLVSKDLSGVSVSTGTLSVVFDTTLITDGISKQIIFNGHPSENVNADQDIVMGYIDARFRPRYNLAKYVLIGNGIYAYLQIVASSGKVTLTPRSALSTSTGYTLYETYI